MQANVVSGVGQQPSAPPGTLNTGYKATS